MSLELEAEARRLAVHLAHLAKYAPPDLFMDGTTPASRALYPEILTLLQKVAHAGWLRGRAEGAAAEHTAWLLDHENYAKRAEQEGWLRGMEEIRALVKAHLTHIEAELILDGIDAAIAKGEGTK